MSRRVAPRTTAEAGMPGAFEGEAVTRRQTLEVAFFELAFEFRGLILERR